MVRKLLPYSTIAAALALIYMGWVFYSRAHQNSELQRQATEKSAEQSRKTYELYGSGHLKIMLFYAVPAVVPKGGSGQLCYSVSNAAKIEIDHGIGDTPPSLSRCIPIKPKESTTYTLTAADDKNNRATKTLDVLVR
jgi:hypothetical protein